MFTQLGANFATVAAWPTPIEVTIVDDCGNLMTNGSVTASFSDSDPTLPLTSLNDGRWSATWQPRNPAAQVVITVDASELVPLLQGSQNIGGALQTNPTHAVGVRRRRCKRGKIREESAARARRIYFHLWSASQRWTESGVIFAAGHATGRDTGSVGRAPAPIAVCGGRPDQRGDPLRHSAQQHPAVDRCQRSGSLGA